MQNGGMDHINVFHIIDEEVEELEAIKGKNTDLVSCASASIATLMDLKRRVEEALEQVPEPQNQGV